jgi:hypothetical protein
VVSDAEGTEIEDFQRLILKDLNFEAFRVLEQEIGEEKAREIFKPHMLNSGGALIMNAQKHLGFEVKDIHSFLTLTGFIHSALWHSPRSMQSITENGIEGFNIEGGCPISNAPRSLKRMVCVDVMPGFTSALSNDYEVQAFCLDMGDKECKFVWRNRHDPSYDWKKNGSRNTIIPNPEFDIAKAREFGVLALGELWLFPTQALMEWKGPDAKKRLSEAVRPLGLKWGKELIRVTEETGDDLDSLLTVFDTYNVVIGQEGRTTFTIGSKHEAEITICPFSVAPNEMGAECGEAIGAQCQAFNEGICIAANPDFEVLFTSKMCAGDGNCHRVIRKKLAARVAKER